MKLIFFLYTIIISADLFAQQGVEQQLKEGDQYYRQQKYAQASVAYSKAIQAEPANEKARFNEANSLYKQDKKIEAVQLYSELSTSSNDIALQSKSWYNKGVVLSNQNNVEESIEAYKNALRNDPNDKDARENLQKALLELKKKKDENKKQQQQQKNKQDQQKQSSPKMQPKEADQRLRLLQQKEKEVQERVQKQKRKTFSPGQKDW